MTWWAWIGSAYFLDKAATTTLGILVRCTPPGALMHTCHRLGILYNTRERASNGVAYGDLGNIHTTFLFSLGQSFDLKRAR